MKLGVHLLLRIGNVILLSSCAGTLLRVRVAFAYVTMHKRHATRSLRAESSAGTPQDRN